MSGIVLILGATGRFGRHAAEAFWNAGWTVRTFDRHSDDLNAASDGADVIVNGWNPAYPLWADALPDLTKRVINAAKRSGATVLMPANIYVYGKDAPAVIAANSPQRANNPLGRARISMEDQLRRSGVQVIFLRAGDFIDTTASGNWFDMVIAKNAHRGWLVAPGAPEAPHSWAYLPDLARAAVLLSEKRDSLGQVEEVLFPGYTLSLEEIAGITARILERNVTLKSFDWWQLRLAAPFWKLGRHLLEMRYLWSMPHRLDRTSFAKALPGFKDTDPTVAIATALPGKDKVRPDQPVARRSQHIAAE